MIVPKKRTALLVDRLLLALKEAIDEEEANNRIDAPPDSYTIPSEEVRKVSNLI